MPYGDDREFSRMNPQSKGRHVNYTMSLTAAMTQDQIVGLQMIQGGMDGSLYESFVYNVVTALRRNPRYKGRRIVLFMDNCRLHKGEAV